jgi:tetratricopeptide (TPR) repeat protein
MADCNAALNHVPWHPRAVIRAVNIHIICGRLEEAEGLLSRTRVHSRLPPSEHRACSERLSEIESLRSTVARLWGGIPLAMDAPSVGALMRECQMVARKMPRCPGTSLLCASCALRAGRWKDAVAHARTCDSARDKSVQLQAWWLNCEALYAQGDLAQCAERLDAGHKVLSSLSDSDAQALRSEEGQRVPLPDAARLLELVASLRVAVTKKEQGNSAFAAGRHEQAVELYTAALGVQDAAAPAFAAVLYSNRAAAYKVLFCSLFLMPLSNSAFPSHLAGGSGEQLMPEFLKAH